MKQVLSVVVNNSAGVLSHVSGLFTRRGYNITSLSVGETENKEKSVITLVVDEDDKMVSQIQKQLHKLADVISIDNLTNKDSLKRELLLITIKTNRKKRTEILSLIDVFKATIVDMTDELIMVEMVGLPRRITAFLGVMSEFGITGVARTGTIALSFPSAIDNQT